MAMKVRNIKYFIKEGFTNIWANKWMGIASACVVLTTLYIFGIFFLFAINVDNMSGQVEDQPMNAFTIDSVDKTMAEQVKTKIEKIVGVKKVVLVTKEEGLNELKQEFDNHKDLLSGLPPNFLSYKLVININNPLDADKVKTSIEGIKEIKKVEYAKDIMEKLTKVTRIVRIVSYSIIVVLGFIALFIIMYTIKLTVFSRRREINIMKYVGATDWFTRWPFVIEGIIIGLAGAIIAIILVIISYNYFYNIIGSVGAMSIKLITLNNAMKEQIFILFALLGGTIGAVGSIVSVRKYLDV